MLADWWLKGAEMNVRVAALLSILGFVGCNAVEEAAQESGVGSLRQLMATPYCDSSAPQRSSWLEDEQALRRQWNRLHGHRVELPPVPAVDFAVDTIVLLEMGSRPSAGFGLDLATTRLTQQNGTQVVTINWREPAPDAMVAQVLTSPCLMIALPSSTRGPIEVRDQDGGTRYFLEPRSVR